MIKIVIQIDRRAALLAGKSLNEREVVDVDPADFGGDWQVVVGTLDLSTTPPTSTIQVEDNTQAEIVAWVKSKIAADAASAERLATAQNAYRAAVESVIAAGPQSAALYWPGSIFSSEVGSGWQIWNRGTHEDFIFSRAGLAPIKLPPRVSSGLCWSDAGGCEDLLRQIEEIDTSSAQHNESLFAAAKPALLAARAEKDRLAAAEAAAEAAEAKAAWKIKYAERLSSGYWERETSSYNERRYSAPWCASVSFAAGPKPTYSWGESTGQWGKSGLLRVACKPGEFIAHGQKDLRRPGNSEHTILRMRDDGSMETMVSATEAYKIWRAQVRVPAAATA